MKKVNRILLIDDNHASSLINSEVIKSMNITDEIVFKSNGSGALKYLQTKQNNKYPAPELILLDLEMPKMNGFKFMEHFAKLDSEMTNNFETVIAIVSNHLDIENFDKCKEFKFCGVLDHIKKPIQVEDVENLLLEHILD